MLFTKEIGATKEVGRDETYWSAGYSTFDAKVYESFMSLTKSGEVTLVLYFAQSIVSGSADSAVSLPSR
jgi:hypothetical protein